MDNLASCDGHQLPGEILVRWLEAARKLQTKAPNLISSVRAVQQNVDAQALQRLANAAHAVAARLDDPGQSRIAAELMADADHLRQKLVHKS